MSGRGKQMPVGNGGVTAHYYWTQTLYELTAFVYVPKGTRGSDLACTISPKRIELKLKKPCAGFGDAEGWLLRGDMPLTCRPDESMWMGESVKSREAGRQAGRGKHRWCGRTEESPHITNERTNERSNQYTNACRQWRMTRPGSMAWCR